MICILHPKDVRVINWLPHNVDNDLSCVFYHHNCHKGNTCGCVYNIGEWQIRYRQSTTHIPNNTRMWCWKWCNLRHIFQLNHRDTTKLHPMANGFLQHPQPSIQRLATPKRTSRTPLISRVQRTGWVWDDSKNVAMCLVQNFECLHTRWQTMLR